MGVRGPGRGAGEQIAVVVSPAPLFGASASRGPPQLPSPNSPCPAGRPHTQRFSGPRWGAQARCVCGGVLCLRGSRSHWSGRGQKLCGGPVLRSALGPVWPVWPLGWAPGRAPAPTWGCRGRCGGRGAEPLCWATRPWGRPAPCRTPAGLVVSFFTDRNGVIVGDGKLRRVPTMGTGSYRAM